MQFFYQTNMLQAGSDANELNAMNVTFEYDDKNEFKFHHLKPRSRYKVQAQAINEAGVSEMSAPDFIETTDPWGIVLLVNR